MFDNNVLKTIIEIEDESLEEDKNKIALNIWQK